jgi:hypothetical protein
MKSYITVTAAFIGICLFFNNVLMAKDATCTDLILECTRLAGEDTECIKVCDKAVNLCAKTPNEREAVKARSKCKVVTNP